MSISDSDFASFYPSTIKIIPDKPFTRVDDGIVDGEHWICVSAKSNSDVSRWLREHGAVESTTQWAVNAYFEMPEKLYMMLVLRWV